MPQKKVEQLAQVCQIWTSKLISDERYVSLSTWTNGGNRKRTPVWIALLDDGRVGFTTGKKTWKVKRILRNPSVELHPCNSRGALNNDSQGCEGVARVVDADEKEYMLIEKAIRKKYGIQDMLVSFFGQFSKKYGEGCGIVISLEKDTVS